jgi:hypothetical protein
MELVSPAAEDTASAWQVVWGCQVKDGLGQPNTLFLETIAEMVASTTSQTHGEHCPFEMRLWEALILPLDSGIY